MRTTSRGIVGAALLALTLAGCAGSGGDEVSGNVTGSGVAKSAGCTGYQAETVQAFTTETGSCQVDGKDIYVMTFKDSKLRDQWLEIGRMAGGSFGEGDRWILQGDDRATVEKAVKAAGGKMT